MKTKNATTIRAGVRHKEPAVPARDKYNTKRIGSIHTAHKHTFQEVQSL